MTITSYPIPQSHMVSYFTSNPQLTIAIRHGFVQCLEEEESTKVMHVYCIMYLFKYLIFCKILIFYSKFIS